MTTEHVLINTGALLSMTFSESPDAGVDVVVTDANGDEVSSGAATVDGAVASYQVDPQSEVMSLTLSWSGTWGAVAQTVTSGCEIVGGHLFTLAAARVFDDGLLGDTATYPSALLRETRAGIAEFFEKECGASFVPMYGRETLDGDGRYNLWLKTGRLNRLLAVTINDVALSTDEVAALAGYESGYIHRTSGWPCGHRNVVVEYEHGYPTTPWEISRAALVLARYTLVSTNLSDRTIALSNELGTVRLSVPGQKYPTGIPVVDTALNRYSQEDLIA